MRLFSFSLPWFYKPTDWNIPKPGISILLLFIVQACRRYFVSPDHTWLTILRLFFCFSSDSSGKLGSFGSFKESMSHQSILLKAFGSFGNGHYTGWTPVCFSASGQRIQGFFIGSGGFEEALLDAVLQCQEPVLQLSWKVILITALINQFLI